MRTITKIKRRLRKSRLEIITAVTILAASALTIGLTELNDYLRRKNVYTGTKNVIADVRYWLNECSETGYINDLVRRAKNE